MFRGEPKLTSIVKLFIMGEEKVGKTSVINRYIGKGFSNSYQETLGTEIYNRTVNIDINYKKAVKVKSIDAQIVDVSRKGSKNLNLRKSSFNKNFGLILIFDITRYETFIALSHIINEIYSTYPKFNQPILVIGNKVDLESERQIANDDVVQFIKNLLDDKKIKSKAIRYIETSAKNGFNVNLAFNEICFDTYAQ